MPSLTIEIPNRPLDAVIDEAPGQISRDNITIASGAGKVVACTVIGKVTASGKYAVSYTHLDVYKRQICCCVGMSTRSSIEPRALASTIKPDRKTSRLSSCQLHEAINPASASFCVSRKAGLFSK